MHKQYMDKPREDSLKNRYLFKLITNILGAGVSFFTQIFIPRGMGPKAYGDFNFLNSFFTQVVNFFDMGSSTGFYTKISQRQKEHKLVSFYLLFAASASLSIIIIMAFMHIGKIHDKLWPGQQLLYIYLACFLAILTWFSQILNNVTDGYGLTVSSELGKISQKFIGLFLIIILFVCNRVTLLNFFFYNYIIILLMISIFVIVIIRSVSFVKKAWELSSEDIKGYVRELYKYSHPLFVFYLVAVLLGIFDRWLLQIAGGSEQQGFYGLSYQIGAVCFLFSCSMTPLITREFSIAYTDSDFKRMAGLFQKHIPLLYSITAFLACFIAVNADSVSVVMGGAKFREATIAIAIMAFYPIHQTYGQLSGSLFFATGRTKLYRNIGIIFGFIGLPLSYFLIAPKRLLGLDAGAAGLAIKTVLLQFLTVNSQIYFNVRLLKLSFRRFLAHQIAIILLLLTASALARIFVNHILKFTANFVMNFLAIGAAYTVLVFFSAYLIPELFGLNRDSLKSFLSNFKAQA